VSAAVGGVARGPVRTAVGGPRYDALVALLCGVFQAGAYLDAWAHVHQPELETFFTPWHAVLYSGFLAVAAATAAPLALHRRPGVPWARTLPPGYDVSLIGVLVFFLGGVLDMLWHTILGIEVDIETLLSPSHLVLGIGSALMLTGPLRAAWRRVGQTRASWPAVLSLAYLLNAFAFWTQFVHPLARPWASSGNRPVAATFPVAAPDPIFRGAEIQSVGVAQALGIAAVLLQAAVLSSVVLLGLRRWGPSFPPGAFTAILGLNAVMVGAARDGLWLAPAAIAAGLVADLLVAALRPSPRRPVAFRTVACAVPGIYFALFFAAVALVRGVWWSIPLWSGSIVLAGAVGWLVSWLVAPPSVPTDGGADAMRKFDAAERQTT
jgi:hypothetical protein